VATTQFDLVTPSSSLFSGQAEMVVCRTVDGEIAFLANHMPYIGALDTCVVRIVGPAPGAEPGSEVTSTDPDVRVAVLGGFVEVNDNHVIMLADQAELAGEIDLDRAREDQAAAQASAPTPAEGQEGAEDDAVMRWAQVRLEAVQAS
jgi:F-type H+-transporting ATPase subunit epsilon